MSTGTVAPTNVFFLIDDYTASNIGGSTSGNQVSPDFSTPTAAGAQWVAQQFATLFQRSVRLVPKYASGQQANPTFGPPFVPAFVPNTTSLALSNAPSGVSY
jgi:hypothetical protein